MNTQKTKFKIPYYLQLLKKVKHFGVKLTNHEPDLYVENYTMQYRNQRFK